MERVLKRAEKNGYGIDKALTRINELIVIANKKLGFYSRKDCVRVAIDLMDEELAEFEFCA